MDKIDRMQPSWVWRRVAIFSWLLFCCCVVIYVLLLGDPTNSIHTAALGWGFGSAAATVFGYAGFAAMEDIKLAALVK